jgi:hypothetical protein
VTDRYLCDNRHCGWIGEEGEMLCAPDPFNEGDMLYACPKCRDQSLVLACDEKGCKNQATCGTPTPAGYRRVCGNHYRELDK